VTAFAKTIRSAFALFAAVASLAAPHTARAAEPGPMQQGEQVFMRWCTYCHAPVSATHPRLPGTFALEAKYKGSLPAAIEQRTDFTPEFVSATVRTGVNSMPGFRKTEISDTELRSLAAWLSRDPK
jgi:mono/diheme cytochrome c family protein